LNRYIKLDSKNKVISIRYGSSIVEGEIQSVSGEIGQIMQEDGIFVDAPLEPIEVKPTLEEQIASLQQDNLILMDALATTYEAIALGGA